MSLTYTFICSDGGVTTVVTNDDAMEDGVHWKIDCRILHFLHACSNEYLLEYNLGGGQENKIKKGSFTLLR